MKTVPHRVLIACCLCSLCVFLAGILRLAEEALVIPGQLLALLGALAVGLETFKWGAQEGYGIIGREFVVQVEHTLRCAVMTCIMFFVSAFVGAIALQVLFQVFLHH